MKNFKKYLKIPPIVIETIPMHGTHAIPKRIKLPAPTEYPTHGKHSEIKEETYKNDEWIKGHDNHHLGDSVNDVHGKIDKYYKDFDNHPGSNDLRSYTSFSYHTNKRLVDDKMGKVQKKPDGVEKHEWEELNDKHNKHVAGLDKATTHEPLKHDLHVYHGTRNFNPGKLAAKHPDRLITSPAYMSTSIDRHQAMRFCRPFSKTKNKDDNQSHIIHIHMKKGQRAGVYIGSNSEHKEEKEHLMPRNSVLKIHPKPDLIKHTNGRVTHVWHAHVVGDTHEKV